MRLILSGALILLVYSAQSQVSQIIVLNRQDKAAISDVLISSGNSGLATTDSLGYASFLLAGKSKVYLTHVGFEPAVYFITPGDSDTLLMETKAMALEEVIITSFEIQRPLLEQSASISSISYKELYRFDETSLVEAFNTYPGVRMEERAPNSYRISIRGSSLRAPFGVRNVKVYWNGIPYTSPDGTTNLNLLDLSNIDQVDIIKGPSGSMYGAGTGGVINLLSKREEQDDRGDVELDFMAGAYGLMKYRLALDLPTREGRTNVSYVRQKAEGYREQSASDRKVFQWSNAWSLSGENRLNVNLLYSDLYYELPGALTTKQLAENPRQARPGSREKNSSVKQKILFFGLSDNYRLAEKWNIESSGYVTTSDFDNAFNTDYKKENQFGYGGRAVLSYSSQWGDVPLKWFLGGEYQFSKTAADNFGNVGGQADTLRFADDLKTAQYFLFSQFELELPYQFFFTAGLSRNYLKYGINRKVDATTGLAYTLNSDFKPVVIPRVTLLKTIDDHQTVRGSVSYGFSPPTIDEVRTNEGSINLGLEAEKGTNFEIGYRGSWWRKHLSTDLTLFYFKLDQTITTYTSPEGVVLFRNAGSTRQKGVEFEAEYVLIRKPKGAIQLLKLRHSYTGHFFNFNEYENDDNDYSGNDLTGVPRHTLANTLDLKLSQGFYLNLTHLWVDEIPLNDANTVYQDPYNLVTGRVGWKSQLWRRWNVEVFAGVENIFDESYSRGNDLNPFGQRYFQPAAGRNAYSGVKVVFSL